ncbi:MAG: hypothetical protein ACQEUO_17215 [Bacillota bacterium]
MKSCSRTNESEYGDFILVADDSRFRLCVERTEFYE